MNKNILKVFGFAALMALGVQTVAEAATKPDDEYRGYVSLNVATASKGLGKISLQTSWQTDEAMQYSYYWKDSDKCVSGYDHWEAGQYVDGSGKRPIEFFIYANPTEAGSVFEGFYLDDACLHPLSENTAIIVDCIGTNGELGPQSGNLATCKTKLLTATTYKPIEATVYAVNVPTIDVYLVDTGALEPTKIYAKFVKTASAAVAKIGDTEYETLQGAVNAAALSSTVEGATIQIVSQPTEESINVLGLVIVNQGDVDMSGTTVCLDAQGAVVFAGTGKHTVENAQVELDSKLLGKGYLGSIGMIALMDQLQLFEAVGGMDDEVFTLTEAYSGYPQAWTVVNGEDSIDKNVVDVGYSFLAYNPNVDSTLTDVDGKAESEWTLAEKYFGGGAALSEIEENRLEKIMNELAPFAEDYDGHRDWACDFEVYFDRDIEAESLALAGCYGDWLNGLVLSYQLDKKLPAGQHYRLLQDYAGLSVPYSMILQEVRDFKCGVKNYSEDNVGATMTVELRMYRTTSPVNGGKQPVSILIGRYDYTLGGNDFHASVDPTAVIDDIAKALFLGNEAMTACKQSGVGANVEQNASAYIDMVLKSATVNGGVVTAMEIEATPKVVRGGETSELSPIASAVMMRLPVDLQTTVEELDVYRDGVKIGTYPVKALVISTQAAVPAKLPGKTWEESAPVGESVFAYVEFTTMDLPCVFSYGFGAKKPEVEVVEPTEKEVADATKVVDDKGEEVTPTQEQTKAVENEVKKVVEAMENPEIANVEKTGVIEAATDMTGEDQKPVVKNSVVEKLQAAAPAGTADQITSDSDVKSFINIALQEAKVELAEEAPALKSVTFDVKPMVETTVTTDKGTETEKQEVVIAQIPNDEIKVPITFRLPLTDAFTVSAIVTHEGDPDRLCMVQGAAGSRYIELSASHFSLFTATPSDVIEATAGSKTILGIKRVDYTVTQKTDDLAAAVPWLKAADTDMPVSKLITTGLTSGDQIQVYDLAAKTYYSWHWNGTSWEADKLSNGDSVPSADSYVLKRGSAFWFKPGVKAGTYTQVGLYSDTAITTKVNNVHSDGTAASFANPVHNLMASPKYAEFGIKEKLTVAAGCANDDVVVIVATGVRYRFNGSVWGQDKTVEKTSKFDKKTYTTSEFVPTDGDILVPAGTAFWYLSAGGAPEFEW